MHTFAKNKKEKLLRDINQRLQVVPAEDGRSAITRLAVLKLMLDVGLSVVCPSLSPQTESTGTGCGFGRKPR